MYDAVGGFRLRTLGNSSWPCETYTFVSAPEPAASTSLVRLPKTAQRFLKELHMFLEDVREVRDSRRLSYASTARFDWTQLEYVFSDVSSETTVTEDDDPVLVDNNSLKEARHASPTTAMSPSHVNKAFSNSSHRGPEENNFATEASSILFNM